MKLTNIDIDLLRALVYVSNAQGFTKAAQQLFRTQSAISLQIKKLEQFTNTQLLERGKEIRLTPAGLKVYEYALKISLPEHYDPHLINTIIVNTAIASTHYDFVSVLSDQASKLIEQRQLDMAFILHTELADCIEIAAVPLSWVSAIGTVVYQGTSIAIALPPEGSHIRLIAQQALGARDHASTVICSAIEHNVLSDFIASGKGIGVMPTHAIAQGLYMITNEQLPPLPPSKLFIKLPEYADARLTRLAFAIATAYRAGTRII